MFIATPSRRLIRSAVLAGAALAVGGVFALPVAKHESVRKPQDPHAKHRWFQIGRASWYGPAFQGQPTASGQPFNMHHLTCAHPTLPLGALVRVTNLHNRRSIILLVNDRGPLVPGRIVDLSYAAAKLLGVHGTAHVRLDLVDKEPTRQEVTSLTLALHPAF